MKTKDAFAFRDFVEIEVLQREIFKNLKVDGEEFLKDDSRCDGEIFNSLAATDDVNINDTNLRKLQAILDGLIYLQEKLIDKRHIPRLIRFKRATKDSNLKLRADVLQKKYDEYAVIITTIQASVRENIAELEQTIQRQNKKVFAQRLKQVRKTAGLTQSQLAKFTGKTQNSINLYESGQREPPLTTLIRLSKILGKTTDYFLGMERI